MPPLKPAFAPPPKKRSWSETISTPGSKSGVGNIEEGLSSPRYLNEGSCHPLDGSLDTDSRDLVFYTCLKHGRLATNLCEKCLGIFVSRTPQFKIKSTIGGANEILCRYVKAFYSAITSPLAKDLLKFVWTVIQFLAQVISACFVCFFMMWFVQPNMSPGERKKKEMDDLRKKEADEEWRARRDREYEEKQREQDAWLKQRDEHYMKEKQAQEDWEKDRDIAYRQRVADDVAWRKERDEAERKRDADYRTRCEEEERDKRAQLEANECETRALAEKIVQTQNKGGEFENDLLRLSDLDTEKNHLKHPEHKPVDTVGAVAAKLEEKSEDDKNKGIEKAVDLIEDAWDRGSWNESDRIKIHKEIDNAVRGDDDSKTARKFKTR